LNDGMFVEKSVRDTPQQMTATDEQILKDKSPYYRVLNLAGDTFNENNTSFYHKSIGGYHAAKLRRYQEMIETYISPEMQKLMPAIVKAGGDMTKVNGDSIFPVLNMLNAKYFIMGLQNGQTVPIQNPYVSGNAWFVDKLDYVDNANQEIATVGKINLKHEAVADKKFADQLGKAVPQGTNAMATLKKYEPNNLVYEVNSDKGGVLVFSEVYYPGWTATVDGQLVELGRVNYVLRAMNIKPGKHEVVLDFHPASIRKTEAVAYASYGILALLIALGIYMEWRRKKETGLQKEDKV
ncbi:MAG: YfhO family protein, partial [Prevotella sp.]